MATAARESRQSVQLFDVDLFRNKLETFMRRQNTEMCEMSNTKKRKLSDRWSDVDKEEMELAEDYRDDLCYQFGKRQCRASRYYPLDDEDIEVEEVSPLALPSPVTVPARESTKAWPFMDFASAAAAVTAADDEDEADCMSLAMRRKLSGYSEVSALGYPTDDSWMSPCPPLSHVSSYNASQSNSHPQTPTSGNDEDIESESFTADLVHSDFLHVTSLDDPTKHLDLDITAMAPHEKNLLAALAPEQFEKAALIKRAFKQSDKLLDRFTKETHSMVMDEGENLDVQMDDGEYDQVFGELMHV